MLGRSLKFSLHQTFFVFLTVSIFATIIGVIVLDVSEYVVAILLLPWVGDFLDIAGFVACLVMFRWVGIVSLLELVPGADILPIFIITWLTWYLPKKRSEKEKRLQKKWR